jgi:CBS domain-containing protein
LSDAGRRYREALRLALSEEFARDDRVFVMGEEVGLFDGSYKVTAGLLDAFGPDRIRDTPISEEGFVGAVVGAAMLGERPVVEIMTLNFLLVAMDQVINHAAKVGGMCGGEVRCPLVIRTPNGAGNQLTAQHSQSFDGWFAGTPGLKVVAPASPADAKGLLKAAIRDEGDVPLDPDFVTPIGRARIARLGGDLTIVAHSVRGGARAGRASTSWTRRWSGSAWPRCRCRTRRASSRPLCRTRTASPRRRWPPSGSRKPYSSVMPLARGHMSRDLLSVEPDLPLTEVAQRMVAKDVGAVLVSEGKELVGILTERDVLRAVAQGIDAGTTVADWMTRDPETLEVDESTEHAAVLMIHGGFRHLPVTEGGDVVGMLSIRDLMRVVLEDAVPRGA